MMQHVFVGYIFIFFIHNVLGEIEPEEDCWMSVNAKQMFKDMKEIDVRYTETRNQAQKSLMASNFDEMMKQNLIRSRGIANREVHAHFGQPWMIPSGINLGGYCMLRMPDSILFFHRMKLRNNTFFEVNYLHNDMNDMTVMINLSLRDLHLKGAYERSLTDADPSVLIYAPTFGQVEFLLKDVKYKMEGRYRLISGRLRIELVSSEVTANDVLMTYINQAIENSAVRVDKLNLGYFMDRLKTDLDKWLKDYFNDFLIYADLEPVIDNIDELTKYDKEKGTTLEKFTDDALEEIIRQIQMQNAESIRVPSFTFKTLYGLQIKIYDGVLRGLDSIYRQSVATGVKMKGSVRKVDSIVAFSDLKVIYRYEAVIPTGLPPLSGLLIYSANELTAHLALSLVQEPETIDIDLEFLDQLKPQSLTIEGTANVMISNFRHLLEHQIIAVMSSTLLHGMYIIKTLPACRPFIPVLNEKYDSDNDLRNRNAISNPDDKLKKNKLKKKLKGDKKDTLRKKVKIEKLKKKSQ